MLFAQRWDFVTANRRFWSYIVDSKYIHQARRINNATAVSIGFAARIKPFCWGF
jgi:hypothetical protein